MFCLETTIRATKTGRTICSYIYRSWMLFELFLIFTFCPFPHWQAINSHLLLWGSELQHQSPILQNWFWLLLQAPLAPSTAYWIPISSIQYMLMVYFDLYLFSVGYFTSNSREIVPNQKKYYPTNLSQPDPRTLYCLTDVVKTDSPVN